MNDKLIIQGIAAPLPYDNLDTDQIMPKQFLRGIDKKGLDKGVLYDMRFDGDGQLRSDFVLNQALYKSAKILIAGSNFGCGSSREHAVWGLQQYGIQAVIAPSFGEIFYSNAMNNRLLLAMLSKDEIQALMADASDPAKATVRIDIESMSIQSAGVSATFDLAARHRMMFVDDLDMIGATLAYKEAIEAFTGHHWAQQPWLKDIASRTRERLSSR